MDFSTSGLLDHAGNIKFQDFLQFYIAGKLVAEHRNSELFDLQTETRETEKILGHPAQIRLPAVYGPQIGMLFAPFARMSFLTAAFISTGIGILIYLVGCWWLWDISLNLHSTAGIIVPAVLAFPPLFHMVVRGQLSDLVFLFFVFTFYFFRSGQDWLAGFALGFAIFKPQFLLGLIVIFLASRSWKIMTGIFAGAVLQLGLAWVSFGPSVMRAYVTTLWHLSQITENLEPGVAPTQMHSLRSFWTLIFPWPQVAGVFYVLTAIAVLYMATLVWKSSAPLSLRFSVLVLAVVLVNPHLFVYDLLVLAPMFFLTADWVIQHPEHPWSPGIRVLLYLSYLLPLFGPLAIWTHLQLSVIVFVGLLIVLVAIAREQAWVTAQLEA